MRASKVIFISTKEKETLNRLKKNYMKTELSKKYRFGATLTEMWFDDDHTFKDFHIDDMDWDVIDDILTTYEEEPLRDNEGYLYDSTDMIDDLADFDELAESKIYHDYKIMVM